MRGLKSDLSACCPPRLCQRVFSAVLKSSLSHFAWRYCHSQPSRRRTPQFLYVFAVFHFLCLSPDEKEFNESFTVKDRYYRSTFVHVCKYNFLSCLLVFSLHIDIVRRACYDRSNCIRLFELLYKL